MKGNTPVITALELPWPVSSLAVQPAICLPWTEASTSSVSQEPFITTSQRAVSQLQVLPQKSQRFLNEKYQDSKTDNHSVEINKLILKIQVEI